MPVKYNEKHKQVLDEMLAGLAGVKPGRMFGCPSYLANGRMFACLYHEEGIVLKLPAGRVSELLKREGFEPFVPMGRVMKEWVLVKRARSGDLRKLQDLFLESAKFTAASVRKPARRPKRKR